jgi:hypothetical protein
VVHSHNLPLIAVHFIPEVSWFCAPFRYGPWSGALSWA